MKTQTKQQNINIMNFYKLLLFFILSLFIACTPKVYTIHDTKTIVQTGTLRMNDNTFRCNLNGFIEVYDNGQWMNTGSYWSVYDSTIILNAKLFKIDSITGDKYGNIIIYSDTIQIKRSKY